MQAPAGAFRTASWPKALPASALATLASPRLALESVLVETLGQEAPTPASPGKGQQHPHLQDGQWRLRVGALQDLVDGGLWRCLQDAILLCGGSV